MSEAAPTETAPAASEPARSTGRRALLALLVGLVGSVFFVANNWYAYTADQILALIGVCAAVTTALSLGMDLLAGLAARLRGGEASQEAADGAAGAVAVMVGGGLLWASIDSLGLPLAVTLGAVAVLTVLVARLTHSAGVADPCKILAVLLLLNLAQWGYGAATARTADWHLTHKELGEGLRLERTPNVYFILAESYPNRAALREVFGIEDDALYGHLEQRGFAVHHQAYSNYQTTLTSLGSMFAMTHHRYATSVGAHDEYVARDLICGNAHNVVLDVLGRNGYRIDYVHQHDYQLRLGGEQLDHYWPRESVFGAFPTVLGQEMSGWLGSGTFEGEVKAALERVRSAKQPIFLYLYIDRPNHSDLRGLDDAGIRNELVAFRKGYPARLDEANAKLVALVDQILAVDPDPLILIMGDHGASGFRIPGRHGDETVTPREVHLDRLGILMATRFPADCPRRPKAEDTLTAVNLFRHVFAALSSRTDLLEQQEPDDGYVLDEGVTRQVLRGGKLLEEPR